MKEITTADKFLRAKVELDDVLHYVNEVTSKYAQLLKECNTADKKNIELTKEVTILRQENNDLRLLLNYLAVAEVDKTDNYGNGVMAVRGTWEDVNEDKYKDALSILERYSDEEEGEAGMNIRVRKF